LVLLQVSQLRQSLFSFFCESLPPDAPPLFFFYFSWVTFLESLLCREEELIFMRSSSLLGSHSSSIFFVVSSPRFSLDHRRGGGGVGGLWGGVLWVLGGELLFAHFVASFYVDGSESLLECSFLDPFRTNIYAVQVVFSFRQSFDISPRYSGPPPLPESATLMASFRQSCPQCPSFLICMVHCASFLLNA